MDCCRPSVSLRSPFVTYLITLQWCERAASLHVSVKDPVVLTHRHGLIKTGGNPLFTQSGSLELWRINLQSLLFYLLNQLSHDDLQLIRIKHIFSLSLIMNSQNKRCSQTTPPKQILINVLWVPVAQNHSSVNDIWRTQRPLRSRCILIWGSKVEMQLQRCTASSSICHHGKSDIWVCGSG